MRGVVAGYGDVEMLHGVDLDLERGDITALLGANGAGKSTLCAVAAGVVEPSATCTSRYDITTTRSAERATASSSSPRRVVSSPV